MKAASEAGKATDADRREVLSSSDSESSQDAPQLKASCSPLGAETFSHVDSQRAEEVGHEALGVADAPPLVRSRSRSASQMAQCEPDPGPKRGPHVLRQSGRRLRDSDLVRIAREKGSGYDEIDFSRNDLTSKSVPDIVDICKKSQQLKILKLFNNRLGDDGAEELGEIFQHCASIEEIHLSHNDFTRKGVEILVLAADRGLPKDVKRPLWLRMEHNKVSDTEGFARDLERDCPAVCGREDRHRCTPRVCAKGRRIHLPFLIEAPKGRGRGKESWGPGQGQGPLRRERRDSRRRPCRAPMRRRSRPKESRSRSARRRPRMPDERQEPSCRLRLQSVPRGGYGGRRASSSRERLPQPPPRRPQLYMRRERVRLPPRLSRSQHAPRDFSQRVAKPKSRQCAAYPAQRLNGHHRRPQAPPQAHAVARRVPPYTRQFVPLTGARDDVEYSYYSYYSEYEDEGSCA